MTEGATGLVLRTRPLTDTSLIVNWLTAKYGRIKTVAKGARRSKSPFRGKIDLFYLADFSFSRSRHSELHNLREVSLRETFPALRRDLAYLQQASYCAMLIEQTCESETPLPEIFELAHSFIRTLPNHPPATLMIFAFEIKLLAEQGLMPNLDATRLSAAAKQFLRHVVQQAWDELRNLSFPPNLQNELRQFLHGFLIFHLGKIPPGRSAAWLEP
jgi:DNA repair protein RecO (recombination protein O)